MQLAFSVLCKRGDKVLVEAATFPGMKAIASLAGLRLHGVALDAEGLEPGALDRAARETGARILYAMPSLQNPTARSMSEGRRRSIVDLAREHDLIIVEDDVYAPYARKAGIPPLASLAPERCFHLGSASKAIAPGLRAGWLLPPGGDAWRMPILMRLRASSLALPGFGHALLTRWIEDGTVERILDGVRAEIATRIDVARRILGGRIEWPAITETPHLWAPLPPVEAERCVARAIELGIALTPPAAVLVDAGAISGLRICLGGAPDTATLERALRALSDALGSALTPLEQTAL